MKTRYIIPLLLLSVFAAVSCDKEQDAPVIEIVPGDSVSLSAVIGAPDTKIHFEKDMGDYTDTRWQEGDCLWVRSDTQPYWERGECFKTSKAKISSDGHSAEFEGRTRVDGKLCAVYPYGLVKEGSDNDKVLVDIAQSNQLVLGDCPAGSNVAAAFWADGSTSFTMKYLLGAVKFSITGNGEKISSFVLLDADSSNVLWGTCEITPDYGANGIASVKMVNDSPARNRIILECDLTLSSSPVEFYFMVPEGCLNKGFVLKACGEDGKVLANLISKKANTTTCGKVVKMPSAKMEAVSGGGQAFEGSGVPADPYLIASPDNLSYLSQMLDSDQYQKYADGYYLLTANLDMSGIDFLPVGESEKPFKGFFDGNHKTVSNLSTSGRSNSNPASGLFAYAESAVIKNLTVKNRSNTGSFNRVGGIVGYAKNCEIENCLILDGELKASANICGGIVAEMHGGSIKQCSAQNVKISNSKNYAGGIVGYGHDEATISVCTFGKNSEISSPNEVGGIVGKMEGGSIDGCVCSDSKVTASNEDAGGIGGWVIGQCNISDSSINGSEISAISFAGGTVGLLENSVITAAGLNSSTVKVSKSCCGGIVGYMKKTAPSTIKSSSVTGTNALISGPQNIGGIVGWMDTGTVEDCMVLSGTQVIATKDGAGGIVGRAISKSGTLNTINRCMVIDNFGFVSHDILIQGAYTVGGIVGYAYPDAQGVLNILNSGIINVTVRSTSCDTGADPSKGDSMCGGIGGWMRFSDSASKGYIINCYSYPKAGGFICDLPMVHPSFGGIAGYLSLSSKGEFQIANCVTSVQKKDFIVDGVEIKDVSASTQVGAIFGMLPDNAGIKVGNCHYIDEGEKGLGIGASGASADVSGNYPHSYDEFYDMATVIDKMNEFVAAYSDHGLNTWSLSDGHYLPL